jgi:hypothetical protein
MTNRDITVQTAEMRILIVLLLKWYLDLCDRWEVLPGDLGAWTNMFYPRGHNDSIFSSRCHRQGAPL